MSEEPNLDELFGNIKASSIVNSQLENKNELKITDKTLQRIEIDPRDLDKLKPNEFYRNEFGDIRLRNYNGFLVPAMGNVNGDFFDFIERRRRLNESTISAICGGAGTGKSWWTIRLAEILDKRFYISDTPQDPTTFKEELKKARENHTPIPRAGQICFSREWLLYLLGNNSPLKYGQVIIIDESSYSMSSRDWFNNIQNDLMLSLQSIRSRGFIILIVSIHISLLDKILRKYLINSVVYMNSRGRGIAYELFQPRFSDKQMQKKLCQIVLNIPYVELCPSDNCLRCSDREKCQVPRNLYEKCKRIFVGSQTKAAEERIAKGNKKEDESTLNVWVERLYANKNKLKLNNRLRPDTMSIRDLVNELFKKELSIRKCTALQQMLVNRYPDDFGHHDDSDRKNSGENQ